MGSTGRGGKPKGERASSWRDWRPDEDTTLKTMIDEGCDYVAIGEKLGRSTYGVMLHAARIGYRMTATHAQLSATDVKNLLGIGDAKTVASWITKFQWLDAKVSGPRRIYRISWDALFGMLENRLTWMAWKSEQITDLAVREWAIELRKDNGHWISAGAMGRRFNVVVQAPQAWVEKRYFVPGDTAVKYGNWWFWSKAVETFVPPAQRSHRRPGVHIHDLDTWERLHYQHRTEWVTIGSVVEESGLTVTFRRGRFRLTEPITARRKKPSPPAAQLPAFSVGDQ